MENNDVFDIFGTKIVIVGEEGYISFEDAVEKSHKIFGDVLVKAAEKVNNIKGNIYDVNDLLFISMAQFAINMSAQTRPSKRHLEEICRRLMENKREEDE